MRKPIAHGIWISGHALHRMKNRGITEADVCFAIEHGKCEYSRGDSVYVLREKSVADFPGLPRHFRELAARRHSLSVVVSPDGVVKTAKWNYERIKHNFRFRRKRRPKNRRVS